MAYRKYISPFLVGVNSVIKVRATDSNENVIEIERTIDNIDRSKPVIVISDPSDIYSKNDIPVPITCTIYSELKTVSKIEYCLSISEEPGDIWLPTTLTNPTGIVNIDGAIYLHVRVTDCLGRQYLSFNGPYLKDSTLPNAPIIIVSMNGIDSATISIAYSASISNTYKIDDGDIQVYSGPFEVDRNCQIFAYDESEIGQLSQGSAVVSGIVSINLKRETYTNHLTSKSGRPINWHSQEYIPYFKDRGYTIDDKNILYIPYSWIYSDYSKVIITSTIERITRNSEDSFSSSMIYESERTITDPDVIDLIHYNTKFNNKINTVRIGNYDYLVYVIAGGAKPEAKIGFINLITGQETKAFTVVPYNSDPYAGFIQYYLYKKGGQVIAGLGYQTANNWYKNAEYLFYEKNGVLQIKELAKSSTAYTGKISLEWELVAENLLKKNGSWYNFNPSTAALSLFTATGLSSDSGQMDSYDKYYFKYIPELKQLEFYIRSVNAFSLKTSKTMIFDGDEFEQFIKSKVIGSNNTNISIVALSSYFNGAWFHPNEEEGLLMVSADIDFSYSPISNPEKYYEDNVKIAYMSRFIIKDGTLIMSKLLPYEILASIAEDFHISVGINGAMDRANILIEEE